MPRTPTHTYETKDDVVVVLEAPRLDSPVELEVKSYDVVLSARLGLEREFRIPAQCDLDRLRVISRFDGLLELRAPMLPPAAPRRIPVTHVRSRVFNG